MLLRQVLLRSRHRCWSAVYKFIPRLAAGCHFAGAAHTGCFCHGGSQILYVDSQIELRLKSFDLAKSRSVFKVVLASRPILLLLL